MCVCVCPSEFETSKQGQVQQVCHELTWQGLPASLSVCRYNDRLLLLRLNPPQPDDHGLLPGKSSARQTQPFHQFCAPYDWDSLTLCVAQSPFSRNNQISGRGSQSEPSADSQVCLLQHCGYCFTLSHTQSCRFPVCLQSMLQQRRNTLSTVWLLFFHPGLKCR